MGENDPLGAERGHVTDGNCPLVDGASNGESTTKMV